MSIAMTERIPGVPISLGQSINVDSLRQLSPTRRHARSTSESGVPHPHFKSKLPTAVANVPPDHIRGYVHNKKVNNYLVGLTLGEGSFAKVKEAFHIQVGEKVAMKVIDKKKAQQDPYVAKNFRREAKLLQMVRHPNILHLMEVIETDTSFYLITELCSGGELMKHIYRKGRLDEDETRKYMRQIISSVEHLHRAGIIHRDLKVENMLLDGNMDIRIIDFGLSNEEYIQGENGRIHCQTQCGSPAYAAPELLGHKQYGPEVDIWSIGVNMYAMLTGCLPYTVEPFNITALHAKMLENKMNPIPDHLSSNCKDLLRRLMQSNPEERIKMDAIMSHPWLNEGHSLPFGPAPFPNKLLPNDVDSDIVEHMVHILKVCGTEEELVQELTANKATSAACIYFLLAARLKRYKQQFPSRKTRVRHRSTRLSQDQGYYEDGDDDETKSTKSVPAQRRPSRQSQTRPSNVPLRKPRGREGSNDRTISHPPYNGAAVTPPEPDTSKRFSRRNSMPPAILENHLAEFREHQQKKTVEPPRIKPWQAHTLPRQRASHTKYEPPNHVERNHRYQNVVEDSDPPYEFDYTTSPTEPLAAVPPHGKGMPRNYSHSHALNQLRKDLRDKLHPVPVSNAWHSNPVSRNHSRNPSRSGSRVPSSTSTRGSGSTTSGLGEVDDEDDIVFHPVKTNSLPRTSQGGKLFSLVPSNAEVETHLPSLSLNPHHPPQSRAGRRAYPEMATRKNGHVLLSKDALDIQTDLSLDAILSEVLRVSSNLKMRECEQIGNAITCTWKGVRFKVSVSKDHHDACRINFQWYSGGDLVIFKDLRDRLVGKLNL